MSLSASPFALGLGAETVTVWCHTHDEGHTTSKQPNHRYGVVDIYTQWASNTLHYNNEKRRGA